MNDQMICGACGMQWDVDDPNPPACRKVDHRRSTVRDLLKADPKPRKLPATPPTYLLRDMEAAHRARGMSGAYRVLLDWIEL